MRPTSVDDVAVTPASRSARVERRVANVERIGLTLTGRGVDRRLIDDGHRRAKIGAGVGDGARGDDRHWRLSARAYRSRNASSVAGAAR